tara:strand:+ start:124 stop:837 length:714 start_codon:yes stop_codon:yes gene_type:complete
MNLVILTTVTTHHLFFIKSILNRNINVFACIETNNKNNYSFSTKHIIDRKIIDYEASNWFNNKLPKIEDVCDNLIIKNINDEKTLEYIKKINPGLILVFGTGLIHNHIISNYKNLIFNFHGGDPQYYRGLDTNLWAIYHSDYSRISTCLHKLDSKFDNGSIYGIKKIKIKKNLKLEQMRTLNTINCIKLGKDIISKFLNKKELKLRKQFQKGRYYSAMPTSLKEICHKKFNIYTKSL